jgi:hypothetical protein
MSRENLTRITRFIFPVTGNVYPTASECNVQSSFQCWVLPRSTEGIGFMSPETPKERKWRFPTVCHSERSEESRHFSD